MTNEAQCGRLLQLFSGIELLASVDIHTYIHTNLYSAKIVRTNLRR